ncbi:hypothetical protein CPB84DRAFT_1852460 [Gymnopilus junonius]|uniref:Uncharacterized protein n=1 Tax=Gymnopilus junonius TaxID=109634 RepID=A0A9P5NBR9_GYMJU|nr:hypothetical protein CPB84DRAFT_1852460 [Gymnopilus junonius]
MFFSTFFTSIEFIAASFAAPINGPQELIVFNPPVLSPHASSSWAAGSEQVVMWNTSGIPAHRLTTTGVILLGHMENNTHPLASGFRITTGYVKVILPKNITARNDYFIVLFGDSVSQNQKRLAGDDANKAIGQQVS